MSILIKKPNINMNKTTIEALKKEQHIEASRLCWNVSRDNEYYIVLSRLIEIVEET